MNQLPPSAHHAHPAPSGTDEEEGTGAAPVHTYRAAPVTRQPDYVPVRAMEDVLTVRHAQIHQYGHTPDADLAKPLRAFAVDIESMARAILDDLDFRRDPARIRRRLVRLGAMTLATIDRLDNEGENA